MKVSKFNSDWVYWEDKDSFALVWDIKEEARSIRLPHDAMIAKEADARSLNKANTGFRDGGNYTYVKKIYISKKDADKTFMLKFEGIYMNAMIYVNEQLAKKSMFGYNEVYIELNDFLEYDKENEIRVVVKNANMTNSRWYSGSGIYRDVYLLESGPCFILPNKLRVYTERADEEYAVICVRGRIKNKWNQRKNLKIQTNIVDEKDAEVARETTHLMIFSAEERAFEQRITVENPVLWSDISPNMYNVSVNLLEDGEQIDSHSDDFGIRTLELSAKYGLKVNDEIVKLRGACIHHDSGLLGAATFEDAQFRQIRKLKEAGFNAVRMAHQPMAKAMLRACDRVGMYVMDEAFDMWNRAKSDFDYALYFAEKWEEDITAMVDKDFNHPSVILYSIGNEIPEIGTPHGAKTGAMLSRKFKEMDPHRYTLASINGVFAAGDRIGEIVADVSRSLQDRGVLEGSVNHFMSLMEKHMDEIVVHPEISKRLEYACAFTDIAGYNYMTARYEGDRKEYPNRIIVGSETYPPEIAGNWAAVEGLPHVIGDFTWTGWDYLGEAGVGIPAYAFGEGGFGAMFPAQLAYCGDFDITGVRRPLSYYREIVFGFRKDPYIAVQRPEHYGKNLIKTPWILSDTISSWSFDGFENKPVVIEVYSPGDEVELFLNQKSLGRKKSGKSVKYRILYNGIYEAGEISAVSYENGQKIGEYTLKTAGSTEYLHLEKEAGHCRKRNDGEELIYIHLWIKDENNNLIQNKDREIHVAISEVHADSSQKRGDIELLGFGSGDPKSLYPYTGNTTKTHHGHAMLILRKRNTQEDDMCQEDADENHPKSSLRNPDINIAVSVDGKTEKVKLYEDAINQTWRMRLNSGRG